MSSQPSLWLFDIDGTLVDTGGAGVRALHEAAEALFGDSGPALDLAGSTDLAIARTLFDHFNTPAEPDRVDLFFRAYLARLEWNLGLQPHTGTLLPGVSALLDHLARFPHITVGLLTGNIEGGALAKTRHYGIDRHFPFGAYGCDHADRNQLGPIALARAAAHSGRSFSPADTLIIGDTPKDIACAKAIGARCLAVATGRFSTRELADAGADFTTPSLESLPDPLQNP